VDLDSYRFLGYRLTGEYRYPEFMYQVGNLRVSDFITPKQSPTKTTLSRKLTIFGKAKPFTLFRVAVGHIVPDNMAGENRFDVGDGLQIRLSPEIRYLLRDSEGHAELLIPLSSPEDPLDIELEYIW
jgi:hypothetical protein